MKKLNNEQGIALITSLMFTVLSLVMTMALLYMVTANTSTSSAVKRYKTTTEAAYAGMEIMLKDVVDVSLRGFQSYSASNPGTSFPVYMKSQYSKLSDTNISACLRTKLTTPRSQWPTVCQNVKSDVSFNLKSTINDKQPYNVSSKIVDTMGRKFIVMNIYSGTRKPQTVIAAGNSDLSPTQLEGTATTEHAGITPPHYPYMYRVEINASRQNLNEKAKITVEYAY